VCGQLDEGSPMCRLSRSSMALPKSGLIVAFQTHASTAIVMVCHLWPSAGR
jgi:hypothetical protein